MNYSQFMEWLEEALQAFAASRQHGRSRNCAVTSGLVAWLMVLTRFLTNRAGGGVSRCHDDGVSTPVLGDYVSTRRYGATFTGTISCVDSDGNVSIDVDDVDVEDVNLREMGALRGVPVSEVEVTTRETIVVGDHIVWEEADTSQYDYRMDGFTGYQCPKKHVFGYVFEELPSSGLRIMPGVFKDSGKFKVKAGVGDEGIDLPEGARRWTDGR